MYDQSSFLIAGIFFASMLVAIEAGYRVGFRAQVRVSEPSKDHVNTIQSSLLGILALLLAFTLSISLQRFDSRSEAVVNEANAIGTAYLRAQLLPMSVRDAVLQELRTYVDQRVQESAVSLDRTTERDAFLNQAKQTQDALWQLARQAADENPNPVTTGLFIQSLNEAIDSFGMREAALNRHVPEVVLLLLYCVFVVTAAVVGYAVGIAGHRPSLVSYTMVVLIVLLVFIIVDLDRPRRGLITVSQKSLIDLQTDLRSAPISNAQPVAPIATPTAAAQ